MTSDHRPSLADCIDAHRDGEMSRQHLDGPLPPGWADGMTAAAELVRSILRGQEEGGGTPGHPTGDRAGEGHAGGEMGNREGEGQV